MALLWAITIWCLWSCWLICQYAHAPLLLTRSAAVLLAAEFVALLVRSMGCGQTACDTGARAAGSVASIDVPVLAGVLFGTAVLHAWRHAAGR